MRTGNKNNKRSNDKPIQTEPDILDPSRRRLLRAGLLGAAAAGASTVHAQSQLDRPLAEPAPQQIPLREALENLTALEAETLDAVVDRILPSDENGPGAREARAVHYIDRSLAAHNARSRESYAAGLQSLHELALQKHNQPFAQLPADLQDDLLMMLSAGDVPGVPASFFSMVRSHTLQGTFSDPYYGGNHDYTGWDLLGYPGVRLSTTSADVAQGRALAPTHQSAYDHPTFTKSTGKSGGH